MTTEYNCGDPQCWCCHFDEYRKNEDQERADTAAAFAASASTVNQSQTGARTLDNLLAQSLPSLLN